MREIRVVAAMLSARSMNDVELGRVGIADARAVYRGASKPRVDAVVAAFMCRPWLLLELLQVTHPLPHWRVFGETMEWLSCLGNAIGAWGKLYHAVGWWVTPSPCE
jgi:hypothetical protein